MSITINTGETYALNGVTYTATSDAVLNTDDDGKISGIASGSVVATLTGKDSSPEIIFDGSTPFDFSCAYYSSATGADTIQVKAYNTTVNYAGGQITYQADGISGAGDVAISGAFKGILPFDVAINIPDAGMKVTFDENNNVTLGASEKVGATLTFPEDLTTVLSVVKPLLGSILKVDEDTANKVYDMLYKLVTSPTTAQLEGDVSWNKDDKKLSITDGSNIALNVIDYALNLAAEGGTVDGLNFFAQLTGDVALGAKFTPSTDENASLHFTAAKNGSQIYDGTINVTAGSVNFDIVNATISTEENSAFTIAQGDYSARLVLNNATSLTYSADSEGVLYFNSGDDNGALDFTLYTGNDEIISASVEAKGSFSLDTENKVVGVMKDTTTTISMGGYVFTISPDADSSADIAFKDDGVSLTPRDGNGKFNLVLKKDDTTLFDGSLKLSGGTVSINPTTEKFSFTEGSEVSITLNGSNPQQYDFKVTGGDASIKVEAESGGKFIITPDDGDGSLDFTISKIETTAAFVLQSSDGNKVLAATTDQNATTVLAGNISISNGSIILNDMGQVVGLTAGTTANVTLGNYVLSATTTDDASFTLGISSDGSISITPQENDGALDISIVRGDTTIFSNTVSVNGTINFNPTTQAITLTDGTSFSLEFNNYTLTAIASGDAASTMSLTTNGIAITPNTGDGTLNITLGTTAGSTNANIEVLSGSFILGQGGALTVAKDTELQLTFSDNYVVNFKATDDAGGAISLGADGITFAPNFDDGGLELSITQNGQTRTASLDVTGGSVTYKLDGSISLTQGTVVRNVFDDGNILEITANTDASGSIVFAPQNGLYITPSTPDALTATLTTGDLEVAKFTSITGTINYSGGVVTASDGTEALMRLYDTWEIKLSTTGGSASVQFTDDRTVYTANDGATFVLDYLDDTTVEGKECSFSDIYATETQDAIELISEGSTFRCNDDEFVFTLEKAGNYTLNGINVTTAADGVQVVLSGDYDTVIVDGVSYNALDTANLSIDADGKAQVVLDTLTAGLADFMTHKTAAGYPQMAAIAFHPDEENPDAPTNYHLLETWTTTSTDNLTLSAIHYSPENPTGKWVILVHGYGKVGAAMNAFAEPYLDQGLDVLIIDQRAAGDSEGEWLTMGVAEANDLAIWTQEITKTNSNAQIILHGVSMGAATVMLSAALPQTENLAAIIEDCGYGNIADVFAALMSVYGSTLGISGVDLYELFDNVAAAAKQLNGGYDIGDAAPIDSIAAVTVPSLFIHGADDSAIPSTNADALYEASGAENKTKLIIDGADHATSIEIDPATYLTAVKNLIDSSTTEIGANIYSADDSKILRGTIYDDTISISGDDVTIDAKGGDDQISLASGAENNFIQYNVGDGNNTIWGLSEDDTLQIGDGTSTYSTVASGDDVIVKAGDGSITLKDARNKPSALIIGESGGSGGGNGGGSYDFDDEETITIAGGGNSSIDLSKEDYDVAYIDAEALGTKNITLGGDNTVVVEGTNAKVNIVASKGNDTIISEGEKVSVSLRGGATEIYAPSGKVTVSGYNPATGAGFRTDYDDILAASDSNEIFFDDGKLTIGAAVITDTDGNNIFNIYDADGELQKFGYATQDGSLNVSREKSNMVLVAAENATLTAGTGNDTVYAFEGSHVDGGAGRNYIEMDERPENGKGVEVALTNGKNTVANFKSGFDYESDRLFCGVNDTVDCKFDGTDLKVKVNNVTRGVVTDIADGTPFVNFLMADANSTPKIVAIQKGETVTVEDEVADLYVGNKSGVDFSNYDETLAINLGSQEQSIGTGEVLFSGINQITVGGGLNTLIGSSANETLTGNSDGITEFGFGAGGGRDVISNFNFDEDKINVSDAVTGVRIIGEGNVRLQVGDGSDYLTIEDAQGEHFNINGFTAKVDSNIDFDDTANYFVATSRNATLTVGDDVEGDAIIWLDNPDRNGSVFKGDIKTLDASNATVKTELAGNDLDNIILAGDGDASLWGGTGGDDLLVGGTGKNTFFYALGNGSDTVSGTNDGDIVYLSGVTIEQISGADFTDAAVALKFSDGGTLTVNEAGKAVDFIVGEQTFVVNDEHNGFTVK